MKIFIVMVLTTSEKLILGDLEKRFDDANLLLVKDEGVYKTDRHGEFSKIGSLNDLRTYHFLRLRKN